MNSAIVVDSRGRVPDLICPGARGCETADGALRVGAAALEITPTVEERFADGGFDDVNNNGVWDPVWIAGFDTGRAATGVHDDSWVRVLSLSQGDTRVALVAMDLIGFFHDDVIRIRQAASDLGFDHIAIASTHQHMAMTPRLNP